MGRSIVGVEARTAGAGLGDLPIELRVGLDLIVLRSTDPGGRPTGRAFGLPCLIAEWRRYGCGGNEREPLIALGVPPDALRAVVVEAKPQWVLTLEARPFARLLRPIRATSIELPEGLAAAAWGSLGYRPTWSVGLFGAGAVAWAITERALRRVGRPDLADRCRLGMLRSLKTSSIGRLVAVSQVRAYRRVEA
jgi:hypothetical protein